MWPRAFCGQRGHRHVDAATARTFAAGEGMVFVGLREQDVGQTAGPYLALGFQLAEDVKGWELVLALG